MLSVMFRRPVIRMFQRVTDHDTAGILLGLSDGVVHRFAGNHSLSGTRVGRPLVEQWFKRLHRLFPGLQFTVSTVKAVGSPWSPTLIVEWTAEVTPAAGPTYQNQGAHLIRLRRGKVIQIHAYEDSQAVAAACELMSRAGITEASAAPIES